MNRPDFVKKIVILGSTGSIGENALKVVAALPDRFQVVGIGAARNLKRLREQAEQFRVPVVALADSAAADQLRSALPVCRVLGGSDSMVELAALPDADIVVCAMVGMSGLKPVLAALGQGTNVALATKEVLVAAGGLVTAAAKQHGAAILPVDSEHSAIFQCLQGHAVTGVRRLILTASGGPFAGRATVDFETVTVAEALRHPRWNMGRKVSVDSATLMNKGLEIMEARWLFDVPVGRIDVVIHPESIVHSMVEFTDGSVLAQMSLPDMRFAIQYAMTWPERVDGHLPPLDLVKLESLHFRAPDMRRFPGLELARAAARAGGTMPVVFNAANEVAVADFLDGKICFAAIWRTVEKTMAQHINCPDPGMDEILEADMWARSAAGVAMEKSAK